MKQKIFALAFAAFSASAFAQDGVFETHVFANAPTQSQLQELSAQEMKETQGAWSLQGLAAASLAGTLVGTYTGGGAYLLSGGKDPHEFEKAAVGGAVGGAINPPTSGVSAIRTTVQALVGAYVNKQMDIMNSID